MREETDYYRNTDRCPHYYPGDESDPYPGQPFFENVEQHKTNHYSQYQEQTKAANTNCRRMTNKGNERRCDGNFEVRNQFLEQLDQIRVACGNDRCDFSDLTASRPKM